MEQVLGNLSVLTAMPIFNLGLLIDGVLVGSIFALAAYGLALVWGVMNVKNLAQGDFIMIGGYITWTLGRYGIDPLLGVPVAAVVLWGIGWILYRTVISKVITRDLFTSLLATFGIAIVIQQGPQPRLRSRHAVRTGRFADAVVRGRADHDRLHPHCRVRVRDHSCRRNRSLHEEEPHGPGDPRDRAGCKGGARPRHRHREGLFVHLLPECGDLRRGRRPRRRGLERPTVPRDDLFDPPLRDRHRRRFRQPAGL